MSAMAESEEQCPICTEEYGGQVVPVIFACCEQHACSACAEACRASKVGELVGNRKRIPCMLCNSMYHSRGVNWSINWLAIKLMERAGIHMADGAVASACRVLESAGPSAMRSSSAVEAPPSRNISATKSTHQKSKNFKVAEDVAIMVAYMATNCGRDGRRNKEKVHESFELIINMMSLEMKG